MPDGRGIRGGFPRGGPERGGFPGGGFPGGRVPFPGPRRFPRFFFFPIYNTYPPAGCYYIDQYGRCCDQYGRCCDQYGRCSYNYGGYYPPLAAADPSQAQAGYNTDIPL